MPKPTTNSVMLRRETSLETPKSLLTLLISAVTTDEQNATTKHTEAIIAVHHHLYALDQFFGLSGSSTVNVTSLYFSR